MTNSLNNAAYFNPLPRKEGDVKMHGQTVLQDISIHSLVKRETGRMVKADKTYDKFQSTPS